MKKAHTATLFALLAAALYAINAPFSKLLLQEVPSVLMAGFLYLGAGIGLFMTGAIQRKLGLQRKEFPLTRRELPFTAAMVVLDIAAPIFLMLSLASAPASSVSLLNNFEIVATALFALLFFREPVSHRLWLAIALVTVSCILLSLEDVRHLRFSAGSLYALAACLCWGVENNCTRRLSTKDPLQIVVIKGLFSGGASLILGFALGQRIGYPLYILYAILLGFVAYGLSIYFYIYAQRALGAAKTSTYYAIAPFLGVCFSFLLFREPFSPSFLIALLFMLAGAFFASTDR
ncbi:MAG: DMT family transporter [Clostridiaceae bacterium]|nr:DMT family transporter [Clostridiaceae bacterium]